MASMAPTQRQPRRSASEPRVVQRPVLSTASGSASFSFGKLPHMKGKFKIEVPGPRHPEYVGGFVNPGPGSYNLQGAIGRLDVSGGKHQQGHPEHRRPPGYSFGASRNPRDTMVKRFTPHSAVRHSSALDTPGPGHYLGDRESNVEDDRRKKRGIMLQETKPAYTLGARRPALGGPSGAGPCEYDTRHQQEVTRFAMPKYSFGKDLARREAKGSKGETDEHVGPGKYAHIASMLTQF